MKRLVRNTFRKVTAREKKDAPVFSPILQNLFRQTRALAQHSHSHDDAAGNICTCVFIGLLLIADKKTLNMQVGLGSMVHGKETTTEVVWIEYAVPWGSSPSRLLSEQMVGRRCDGFTPWWQRPETRARTTPATPCDVQATIALKAAAEGDESAVLAFLRSGGDVNAKSKTGARCAGDTVVLRDYIVGYLTEGTPSTEHLGCICRCRWIEETRSFEAFARAACMVLCLLHERTAHHTTHAWSYDSFRTSPSCVAY